MTDLPVAARRFRTRSVTFAAFMIWGAPGSLIALVFHPDFGSLCALVIQMGLAFVGVRAARRVRNRHPALLPLQLNAVCTAGIAYMHLSVISAAIDPLVELELRAPLDLLSGAAAWIPSFLLGFTAWRVAASALTDRGMVYSPNPWFRRTGLGFVLAVAAAAALFSAPALAAERAPGAVVVIPLVAAPALFIASLVTDSRIEASRRGRTA